MTPIDLIRTVRRIATDTRIVGVDVVEVAPAYDHADITADNGTASGGKCCRGWRAAGPTASTAIVPSARRRRCRDGAPLGPAAAQEFSGDRPTTERMSRYRSPTKAPRGAAASMRESAASSRVTASAAVFSSR